MSRDWPPEEWREPYEKYYEWAAWYSGDPEQLLAFYSSKVEPFWSKDLEEDRRTMVHIPVAGDIAGVSADLLLSEPPEIKIPEAHEEKAPSGATDTQDRLDKIIEETDAYSRMLEAAETAAAFGGVFVKINWDTAFREYPVLSIAQPDNAIPEFRWGFLRSVTFHRVVEHIDTNNVIRHIEIHEPGKVYNQLYKGGRFRLGTRLNLEQHEATAGMEPEINTGIKTLTCRYIPNKLPNRLWRGASLGQSDLSGIEGLMDSIDEAYSDWVRELGLARARLIIPESWLELEDGKFKFNLDKEVYVATAQGPASAENQQVHAVQFEIRADQYHQTITELMKQAYAMAGYSPSSFGMREPGEQAVTAAEVKSREGKSFKTRNKKARYLQGGIADILHVLLQIDKVHFNSKVNPEYRPQAILQDSIQTDPMEKADSLAKLEQAQAISIDTKVRILHPEWSQEQIEAEVERIMQEKGMAVETPEMRV